jgi:RNA ligase (TIGR02306 family)
MSSDSRVFVVKVDEVKKHTNADTLGIVEVFGGYPCIVRLVDFSPGDLAAYVPIDMIVDPSRPQFTHLAGKERIKAIRLRGVFSMGLLVKAPEGSAEGDDVTDVLGCVKWEPDADNVPAWYGKPGKRVHFDQATPPSGYFPYYDIENIRKWGWLLSSGEEVVLTEKIHGSSCIYHHDGETFHVRSRNNWRKSNERCHFWRAALTLGLDERLSKYPHLAFYGEVYGPVQDLKYDVVEPAFRCFDVFDKRTGQWLSYDEAQTILNDVGVTPVPLIYRGPWSEELIERYSEGQSLIASHVREGFVVKPTVERHHERLGRVILKSVGQGYLLRKGVNN